jgi:chemotaxis protein histidine kinase CheA/ActR/RegA family two-component response regulator
MQAEPGHTHRTRLAQGMFEQGRLLRDPAGGVAPSLRDCWRAANALRSLAEAAGAPTLAGLLRHISSGIAFRAGNPIALSTRESSALGRWFDALAEALEGDAGDAIEAVLRQLAELSWMTPLVPLQIEALRRLLPLELGWQPSMPDAAQANGAVASDPAVSRASARLQASGIALDGLEADEILALAEALGEYGATPEPLDPPALTDTAPEAAAITDGPVAHAAAGGHVSSSVLANALARARAVLAVADVDTRDLGDDELLALAEALAPAENVLSHRWDSANERPLSLSAHAPEMAAFEALPDAEAGGDGDPACAVAGPADGTSAAEQDDIWIAAEELELTRAAITDQILPLALALVAADPDQRLQASEDLAFQLSLIGNAMELLGTPRLCALLQAMSVRAACGDPRPETLMQASAALVAFLESPGPDSAPLLCEVAVDTGLAEEGWNEAFLGECARLRLGLDPARVAARKHAVEPGDTELVSAADVLPNVLTSMLRELPGHALRLGESVRQLVATGDPAPIDEARRAAHSLKGDANTVGIRGLANLTHALEDILVELLKAPERLHPALADLLLEATDTVEECADHVLGQGPAPSRLADVYQQTLDWSNALFEGNDSIQPQARGSVEGPLAAAAQPLLDAVEAAAQVEPHAAEPERTLAVETGLLDDLQRVAGELLVLGRQLERRIEGLAGSERELRTEVENERKLTSQLDDLVALRGAALQSAALSSTGGVDALELDQYNELHAVSRRLLESNTDNVARVRQIERALIDLEPLTALQLRLNDEIQRLIGRTRTVAFKAIVPRLQRVVRQTARQLDRPTRLGVEGESIGIDAEILERLVEPLSHVLRNAIDHGIEPAEERARVGKPAEGAIHIVVSAAGDSALIQVRDDGCGLDLQAISRKAQRLGLLEEDAQPGDDALARLVLSPGFSTRDSISQVSGRGVGMDVVNQRIRALRGAVSLQSSAGAGMTVSLRVPLSSTLADVIVVSGHELTLAATASSVRAIITLNAEQMGLDGGGRLQMDIDGRWLPAHTVESLFLRDGPQSLPGESSCMGLVIDCNDGQARVLCVHSVTEVIRTVVKPVSPLLPPIPAVRGITQLGDGRLASVVDVASLLERDSRAFDWAVHGPGALLAAPPRVVVADDSLSVRRALEQLMQDAGYEVAAARDGVEALQLIAERTPVAVLLDLEMPRMNGLEVCRFLRSQAATRDVPVLMITSRTGDKYRLMAEESGVTRLLGKPFSEDALVSLVGELIADDKTRHDHEVFQ